MIIENGKIEVDTSETMSSLDKLGARIKAHSADLEQCSKNIEALAKKTPWYKRVPMLQWVILFLLVGNIAAHFMRR